MLRNPGSWQADRCHDPGLGNAERGEIAITPDLPTGKDGGGPPRATAGRQARREGPLTARRTSSGGQTPNLHIEVLLVIAFMQLKGVSAKTYSKTVVKSRLFIDHARWFR